MRRLHQVIISQVTSAAEAMEKIGSADPATVYSEHLSEC